MVDHALVPPGGFEPRIATLRGWRPNRLDQGGRGRAPHSRSGITPALKHSRTRFILQEQKSCFRFLLFRWASCKTYRNSPRMLMRRISRGIIISYNPTMPATPYTLGATAFGLRSRYGSLRSRRDWRRPGSLVPAVRYELTSRRSDDGSSFELHQQVGQLETVGTSASHRSGSDDGRYSLLKFWALPLHKAPLNGPAVYADLHLPLKIVLRNRRILPCTPPPA